MTTLPGELEDLPTLSVQEVADTIGLSYHAVLRAVHRGELPAYKVCGRVRLRKEDLLVWIGACRYDPPADDALEDSTTEPGSRERLREIERHYFEERGGGDA